MKKNRAALGIAACLLAGSAMAQTSVSVMGTVDMFAGSLQRSGEAGRSAVVGSGGMTTSWFGFKGTEDLGSGLRADLAGNKLGATVFDPGRRAFPIFAGLVVIGPMAMTMYELFAVLEKRTTGWAHRGREAG